MKNISLSIFCLILIFSCKQEDIDPVVQPDPNAPTLTSPTPFYGVMMNTRSIYITNDVVSGVSSVAEAMFCNSTFTKETSPAVVYDAGTVSLNGRIFKKIYVGAPSLFYQDSTHSYYNPPCTWKVTGANSTPYIYYYNTDGFPVYNEFDDLPDTIHKTGAFSFTFNNYSNADEVMAIVGGFNRVFDLAVSNTISYDSTTICNIPNNVGTITFYLRKNKYILVQGRVYKVENVLMIQKTGVKYVNF